MKNYVVYSRGLLRYEGPAEECNDYSMEDGRPTFYGRLNENDKVTIFMYAENGAWNERRDYVCLDTEANEPMRAKSRVVSKF